MLSGQNGILNRAEEAETKTEESAEREKITLAVMESKMNNANSSVITAQNLENAMKQQFGSNKNFTISDNGDGSFLINVNYTNRMYYIDDSGAIIDNENILKINTVDKLKSFRDDVNNGNTYEGKYVYLTNNITLDKSEEWDPIGLYTMESSSPTDEKNKPFKGIFDGCGYEIDGIYINTTNKVQGLFGLVVGGKIKRLGIGENCSITANLSVGAVAGYLYKDSSAINCYNKSNLNVGSYSGGVCGQLVENCNLEECYNKGEIIVKNDSSNVGGISGDIINSNIRRCYNEGTIKSSSNEIAIIGGISASLNKSILEGCFNTGEISGNNIIGGISGQIMNNGIIRNCYNLGKINGKIKIGGISGQNTCEIYNCYNIGNIEGTERFGGITGENNISTLYNTNGIIKNTYLLKGSCENICSYNNSVIENSSIKSENEMKLLALILGMEFKEDTQNINNGYPILNWQ